MASPFAIIDCETTGFGAHDRILEVAVVVLDGNSLDVVDEFDTLLNPLRDVGRSDLHGITPSMIAAAPTFDEVLGAIARRVDGAVLVGHNLSFDQRFLSQECERAGVAFDAGRGHCTYRLTGEKLAAAVTRYGIPLEGHHRALVDARATAQLFRRVVEDATTTPAHIPVANRTQAARTLRREAVGAPSTTPLARLLARACYPSSLEACVAYFEMLDWVLADGVMSSDEQAVLDQQTALLGLTPPEVRAMQEAYYRSILLAVERDHHVSESEVALLESVARCLSLENAPIPKVTATTSINAASMVRPGQRVCFTGAATDRNGEALERAELERMAAAQGMQPVSNVTRKSCDLLVAADPESNSGKTQLARKYGVPVISVDEFLRAIDAR
jgi:DNA polymerase-3 subunit epsilon